MRRPFHSWQAQAETSGKCCRDTTASSRSSPRLGNQDFARLRIGVGQPPPGTDRVGWVLGEMSSEDQELVDDAIDRASQAITSLMEDGIDRAMGRFN